MILFLLFFLTGCDQGILPPYLEAARLEGHPAYFPGDEPTWAIASPESTGTTSRKPDRKYMGWHILTFFQKGPLKYDYPALLLERAGCAHEVFVNGTKIGTKGEFGYFFVDAPFDGGIYRIPKGLILSDRDNRIAVRTLSARDAFSVPVPSFFLGDWRELILTFQRQAGQQTIFDMALTSLLLVFLASSLALYASGMRGPEYRAFIVLVFFYLAVIVLDSRYFFDSGLKNWMSHRLFLSLIMLVPAAVLHYVYSLNRQAKSLQVRVLFYLYIILAAALLVTRVEDYYYLDLLLYLTLIWGLLLALFTAVRAWQKNRYESATVVVGICGILSTLILDAAGLLKELEISFFMIFDLGFVFFLTSIGYGLLHRYVRTHKQNLLLSGKVIKAHQEERMRFSRDIHDGLGQSLAALKLSMQLIAAGKKGQDPAKELAQLVPEVARISGEVRGMAKALRPAFVEELSVADLLSNLAAKLEDRTGITADVRTADCEGLDLSLDIKDNLFRLCQEAMNNVARHSNADRVDISVVKNGEILEISIRDNGRGFDFAMGKKEKRGVGLSSMEERADLMGGRLSLESEPGQGTRVKMEIPLP